MKLLMLSIVLLALGCAAAAQTKIISIVTDVAPSVGQDEYIDVLRLSLQDAGFDITIDEPVIQIRPSEFETFLADNPGSIGLSFLQRRIERGDSAAALLSTPGAFIDLKAHRDALLGPIGDIARDEVSDSSIVALRLWTHSTTALVSSVTLASIDDFAGVKTATFDPYSQQVLTELSAVPTQLAFAEVIQGLQTGVAEAAIVSQSVLQSDELQGLGISTIIPEHKYNTAVTLTALGWWTNLTAGDQRRLIEALELAGQASAASLQIEVEESQRQIEGIGLQPVSWQPFNNADVQLAVRTAVRNNVGIEATPVIELRDDIEIFRIQRESDPEPPIQQMPENTPNVLTPQIFFASDRRFDADAGSLSDQFANSEDPSETLRCGQLAPALPAPVGAIVECH